MSRDRFPPAVVEVFEDIGLDMFPIDKVTPISYYAVNTW